MTTESDELPRRTPSPTKKKDRPSLVDYLASFADRRVLVVGDLILDHYVHGAATRISPEAPVLILTVESEEYLPGGAANVARNLASLGAAVDLVGLRGDDVHGAMLETLVARDGAIELHSVTDATRPTTLKTRCVAQGQQMLRLDRERASAISGHIERQVKDVLERRLRKADGVIISDYGKGLLTAGVLADLLAAARRAGKPVFVDPKGSDYRKYRGASYLTPNQKEAQEAAGVRIEDDASLAVAADRLLADVDAQAVFITRGSKGVAVFPRRGQVVKAPARAREVFDVTGAGDTFIAVSALTILSGGSLEESAQLGNAAAGIVVGRFGVASVTPAELELSLRNEAWQAEHPSTTAVKEARKRK